MASPAQAVGGSVLDLVATATPGHQSRDRANTGYDKLPGPMERNDFSCVAMEAGRGPIV